MIEHNQRIVGINSSSTVVTFTRLCVAAKVISILTRHGLLKVKLNWAHKEYVNLRNLATDVQ